MSTFSRWVSSRTSRALRLTSVGVAALVVGCNEQKIQTGFEGDIVAPIVSIARTAGDTMDVQAGLRFSVSAADNLGLKTISVALTGGFTGQVDTTFRSAVTTTTLPINITFPKNTTAGGWVYILVTATDGNNNGGTARDSIYLTNVDALIVTLFRPLVGALTSAGKGVLVLVQANQKQGIKKVGWIAAGVVVGSDSVVFAPPGLQDTVLFTDTLLVPASATTGNFTVAGFAEDSSGRRVLTPTTLVTIQSVATDNTPPVVSFSVAQRVEVRDSIEVRATDPSGITRIGWNALDRNSGAVVGGDSANHSGTLTDVSQKFSLNLSFTTFPQEVIITAFAIDAANNRGQATVGGSPTGALFRDTITVVNGITRPLPIGGRIADAIYNRNLNEIYLTNIERNRIEIFSLVDTSFKTPIGVPAQPWGIALWPRDTLGANADTIVVANSGATYLTVLNVQTRRIIRTHKLPNFLIQTVQTEIDPATNTIQLKITEFDFTDRPEYLGMTCRPAGGTACPPNAVFAIYSTTPTAGQSGDFANRGTMRWENMNPALQQSHFFWEHAEVSPSPDSDTLQIIVDHGPGTVPAVDLSAACGVTVTTRELAFLDTTYVRNSGNFTHALIGEGGTGDPVRGFARAIGYDAIAGLSTGVCSSNIGPPPGVPFSGPLNRDNGISPAIRVRDFISNTAIGVKSIATNFNGQTVLIRADSVYVLNSALRLMGILDVGGLHPGMDLNFDHRFTAGDPGTPNYGGTLNPNDRLVFVARPDGNVDAFDTFFNAPVATIPLREPITGPLRVARLPSGQQLLVGITSAGVVTVTLPAIANIFDARKWGTPRAP